ncbi:biotin--[acetyl-CoA-carboxylase] ligase [Pelagibacterium montanilacus]|uniref:biotin--[acetyl-CoA-carboxylase] ligase n=1 Tax=Pelagibacterium montanilacus TaxID=2185280 RepID=UPI000F8EC2C6|nr:biotin--[acetyl-CoA-carboxylase] ligase [Pelagibacterium montanilacus]
MFALTSRALDAGYRVIGHETVGSTNAEALAAAGAGDPGRLWIAALSQSAGRGRRGRVWESAKGNLAATVMIRPGGDAGQVATLGFVAGVALNRTLNALVPKGTFRSGLDGADGTSEAGKARIALKWPNDVLVDGGKVAGILLETQISARKGLAVAIGFGVNVVAAPQDTPYPAISLADLELGLDAPTVFAHLADNWIDCLADWNDGAGVSRILDQWRSHAAGLGSQVAIQSGGDVVRGTFEAIDDAGRLVVRDMHGHRTAISAGDVHFGATATLRA